MNPNLFFPLACLCCLAGFVMAQPVAPLAVPAPVAPFLGNGQQEQPASVFVPQDEVSPEQLNQQRLKADLKRLYRSYWDDDYAYMRESFKDSDAREMWGFSDEQMQQYEQHFFNALEGTGLVWMKEIRDKEGKIIGEQPGGTKTSGEEENSIVENARTAALNHVLTPVQWQIINETQLANMGNMSIISPSMFGALDLTDAQRQEMVKIKEDLKWEFEEHLDIIADHEAILSTKMTKELHRLMGKELGDVGEADKLFPTILKTMEKDPDFKQKREEVMSRGKAFSMKFKIKMFDVLSDEQWVRLQNLIDNPPEHAKALLEKIREQRGEAEKSGVWTPGPNSWQPGDPIPEGYRQQRQERGRFPRVEQSP